MTINLDEAKAALLIKQKELQDRLERVDSNLYRKEGPLDKDFAEQAVELENKDVVDALSVSINEELNQISQALDRIGQGVYDKCSSCGNKINPDRLEAIPTAQLCIKCAS